MGFQLFSRQVIFALAICLAAPLAFAVPAQAADPDPMVTRAIKAFDKIEAAVEKLPDGDVKNLKAQYDALKAWEPRLEAVRDKGPVWQETVKRYEALHQHIVAKAEASPGVDPAVEQAKKDLDHYESLAASLVPGDVKNGQLYVNEMHEKIEKPLRAVENKNEPEFQKTAQRYFDLQKKIVDIANSKATAQEDTQPAAQETDQGEAEPGTVEAMAAIEDYEAKAEAMAPGDVATGKRSLTELGAVADLLRGAENKHHPLWQEARTRFKALNDRIVEIAEKDPNSLDVEGLPSYEQAKIKRLNRSVLSTHNSIGQATFQSLLDAATVTKFQDRLTSYRNELSGYSMPDQSAVVTVGKNIDAAEGLLQTRAAEAQAKGDELGDIEAQTAQIDENYGSTQVPYPQGFDPADGPEAAQAYVTEIMALKAQSETDMATLDRLEAAGVKHDKIGSLRHWAGWERQEAIKKSLGASLQKMDARVETYMRQVDFHANTDPKDKEHAANRLIGEGQREETLAALEEGQQAVNTAAAFDQALERSDGPDRQAQAESLASTAQKFEENFQTALNNSRLPEPSGEDEKYHDIAVETLANPKYDSVNPYRRLVVHTKVRRKEKKEGDLEVQDSDTATLTLYHYVWEEFQVATAEEVGDRFFIYYTTFKYFHSGAPSTPLDRWVMAGRFQSVMILEENIDK